MNNDKVKEEGIKKGRESLGENGRMRHPFVSIIVAVRNEEENIYNNLKFI